MYISYIFGVCYHTLCCWGFHASVPSEALRLSHPLCSVHPGIQMCHIFHRWWNQIRSLALFCVQNKCLCHSPWPSPPLPAVWGDDCLQVLDPTRCPCIRPQGWASASNLMWLPAHLWWRKNFTGEFSLSDCFLIIFFNSALGAEEIWLNTMQL